MTRTDPAQDGAIENHMKVVNDACTVPPVMSRKKDFIPAIGQMPSMEIWGRLERHYLRSLRSFAKLL